MKPGSIKELMKLRADFDRCWPWLWESMCEFGPTHTKEQVWFRICAEKAFLWSTKGSTVVGEIIDYPIGLRVFYYWLQGGDIDELKTLWDGIEEWATTRGAHQARGIGRDGWSRAMNGKWRKGPTTRMKWLVEPPAHVVRR